MVLTIMTIQIIKKLNIKSWTIILPSPSRMVVEVSTKSNTYITRTNQQFILGDDNSFRATIIIITTTSNHQMVIIVVHVGKNMLDDVILDGDSKVNVITNGLKWK